LLTTETLEMSLFGTTGGGYAAADGVITSYTIETYSAVPEPATYAALLGVAALGGVMIRRRREGWSRLDAARAG
jgi:hypothetical protein